VTHLRFVNEDDFRGMLKECRYTSRGQRPGFVPFNAQCLASRVGSACHITRVAAMRELGRLARQLGGELIEGEVLWLPTGGFLDKRVGTDAFPARSEGQSSA
jgi:hypothetical protein